MARLNYEKGIHKHWMRQVPIVRSDNSDEIIRQIKENFNRGSITEVQLIKWGREYQNIPHAFIETLLYCGLDM
jgi:hypothetical protein